LNKQNYNFWLDLKAVKPNIKPLQIAGKNQQNKPGKAVE
jgi:hypothetical protein